MFSLLLMLLAPYIGLMLVVFGLAMVVEQRLDD